MRNAEKDREIIAAATEGVWAYDGIDDAYCANEGEIISSNGQTILDCGSYFDQYSQTAGCRPSDADARFIVEARQAFPHYLERAVAAEQRVAELEQKITELEEALYFDGEDGNDDEELGLESEDRGE